jgi:hypothetical protein
MFLLRFRAGARQSFPFQNLPRQGDGGRGDGLGGGSLLCAFSWEPEGARCRNLTLKIRILENGEVYIGAAIFERDNCVIAKRLTDAEDAIIRRTRELYQDTGAAVETEGDALDDAKYALEALRVALVQRTRAA